MFANPVFITPGRYTYDLLNEYWPENPSGMRDTWHFSLTFWYFNWILSYQLSYTNLLRRVRNSTRRVSRFTANYHHSPKSWQSAVFNLPVTANEQRVRSLNRFFFGKQVALFTRGKWHFKIWSHGDDNDDDDDDDGNDDDDDNWYSSYMFIGSLPTSGLYIVKKFLSNEVQL